MNPNTANEVRARNTSSEVKASVSGLQAGECAHCAAPVGSAPVSSDQLLFCCRGCQSVYHLLRADGYARYYEMLASAGQHGERVAEEDSHSENFDPMLWVSERGLGEYLLYVPAMSCAACIWLLEHAAAREAGVESARVDLEQRTLLIRLGAADDHTKVLGSVIQKLRRYGYPPVPPLFGQNSRTAETRKAMVNLGIAAAAFGNVMLFATSAYFGDVWGIDDGIATFFNWWSFLITSASLIWPGRIFFQHALMAIRARLLHIDLPIALALAVAWATGVFSLLTGGHQFYWDSITGLVFLLLTARYVNDRITDRAKNLAGTAASLLPPESAHCQPGDLVMVAAGQNFPADGKIAGGKTTVDESALTGEARAVVKSTGDKVLGGSRNLGGAVTLHVEAAGEHTWIRQLENRIRQASSERSRTKTIADKILPWFTLATVLLTIAAGIFWWGAGPARAFEVMCVILIVSCPCAVALATPLSMTIAFKRAWEHGAIIKDSDSLERLAKIDTVVLDKTGTLTKGHPAVRACFYADSGLPPQESLSHVLMMMSKSLHPVARGITSWLKTQVQEVSSDSDIGSYVEEVTGFGMVGIGRGVVVIAGRDGWVLDQVAQRGWTVANVPLDAPEGHASTSCLVAVSSQVGGDDAQSRVWLIKFHLSDEVYEDVKDVTSILAKRHDLWLLTGDRDSAAFAVAAAVGIRPDRVIANATPETKLELIRKLALHRQGVLMIGDGINDAGALAAATVGIAVKGGVDVALNSADVFLTKPGLGLVADLVSFARYTRRTLMMLMAISIAYNAAAVSFAFAGLIHPGIAALIMPLSSLTVLAMAGFRKGEQVWKFSSSWCPLPLPSRASQSSVSSGLSKPGSLTT